jgi:hypothetical protein
MKKRRHNSPIIIPNQGSYIEAKHWYMTGDLSKKYEEERKQTRNQKLLALKNHK